MVNNVTVQTFIRLAKVSSPSFSESALVDELVAIIGEYGWDCELTRQVVDMAKVGDDVKARYTEEELTKKTEQLLVRIKGNDASKASIYFCAHIDTVNPAENVNPIVTEDRITSDGTTILGADDKAGVAAMLTATNEIIQSNAPRGDIMLFFTALEEKGSIGASQIDVSKLNLDYGYVFDTTERVGKMVVRTQHVQSMDVSLQVDNLPNHANACTVENALGYASRMIADLNRTLRSKDDMSFTQVVKLTTENEKGYMVPYKATFKLTIRSFDKQVQQLMVQEAIKTVTSYQFPNLTVSYTLSPAATQGYNHKESEMGRAMLEKGDKALRSIGINPVYSIDGLGSHDASKFIFNGLPSLVFSCGMQQIHTVNEWVYIQDLIDTARLIKALILA